MSGASRTVKLDVLPRNLYCLWPAEHHEENGSNPHICIAKDVRAPQMALRLAEATEKRSAL